MRSEDEAGKPPVRGAFEGTVDENDLGSRKPEDLVAACREVRTDPKFRGKALDHLSRIAKRYLTARVDKNLPDGGRGVVEAVVDGMLAAILDPGAADGVGYAAAFHAKLRQRLVDQVRKARLEVGRFEPANSTDGDEGDGSMLAGVADRVSLNPEESMILQDILAALPEHYRKAFLLDREGYPMSSGQGESIAVMLGITPKTAKGWIERAEAAIRQHLGPDR